MSGTKQSLAQIPNIVESTVRTSYIICDAQWQQEIAGPFVQKSLWITRWQQEILKPSAEPSEGFPVGSAGKESSCNAGDTGMHCSIPGLGRSPGVGNGNPLKYPCLENSLGRGAWWDTVHGVVRIWTRLRKSRALWGLDSCNAQVQPKRGLLWGWALQGCCHGNSLLLVVFFQILGERPAARQPIVTTTIYAAIYIYIYI